MVFKIFSYNWVFLQKVLSRLTYSTIVALSSNGVTDKKSS